MDKATFSKNIKNSIPDGEKKEKNVLTIRGVFI
jgi:hypothetical protein